MYDFLSPEKWGRGSANPNSLQSWASQIGFKYTYHLLWSKENCQDSHPSSRIEQSSMKAPENGMTLNVESEKFSEGGPSRDES